MPGGDFAKRFSVVIEPWARNSEWTTRLAIHELGHTMGLVDVDDNIMQWQGVRKTI